MSEPLLSVAGLSIHRSDGEPLVERVGVAVAPGETVAIVGESGSGKSLTAKAVVGLLPAGLRASGSVRYRGAELLGGDAGAVRRLRGSELGMVFQDPFTMLNPLMRAGRQIAETLPPAARGRAGRRAVAAEVDRRLAEVGIDDSRVAARYPYQLSGGMRQRVGIAAALTRDPQLLIADEPTTALDVTTQRDILLLLRRLQASRGMSLVLITHDLRVAFTMADRVYVFYAGGVVECAASRRIEHEPLHPYSLGLLLSEPPSDRRLASQYAIAGSVPEPAEVAGRCRFSDRCGWVRDECLAGEPELREVEPGRRSACVRVEEIRPQLHEQRQAVQEQVAVTDEPLRGDELLVVRGLVKEFPSGRRSDAPFRAVDDVSIHVAPGESVGIVGESGSGKTTLARCIVGLEQPTGGEIVVDGTTTWPPAAAPPGATAALRRAVQIVFQDPYSSLNPSRTIGASLRESLRLCAEGERRSVGDLLELVGLPAAYAGRKPSALSGGERQRVAIARALGVRPQLVICDEAVSALDVSVQAQVLNLLDRLRRELGLSLLFITHDLAVVRQVADRAYVMLQGRVAEHGPVERILDAPSDPYTQRLVRSVPTADGSWLDGEASRAVDVPA